MKKVFTLLTLLLCAVVGVQAQTYTDEAATVTWAFTSHTSLGSTNVPADAFLATNFSSGSNLTALSFNTEGQKAAWETNYEMVAFKATTAVAKNAADDAANLVEWTITPATGITFTPANISMTACTYGGTGDPQVTIYAVYADETQETLQTKVKPNRPDKKPSDSGYCSDASHWSFDLASPKAGKIIIRAYMAGLPQDKGVAFTNIVVTGKVSGTPVATTTYDITVESNDATLGSATGGGTFAEDEVITLTATAKDAGYFSKWQKDGADFDGNTANPIDVTVTANATYTAVFVAKKAITFDKGEGTGTAPAVAYVLSGDDFTIPEAFFIYKAGATLTGWNDGTNDYNPGDVITNVTTDIALTAQYTDNTVALGDASTVVNWNFARNSGAPTINCEGAETDYVQHTTIGGTPFDAVMHINTVKNAVIDGSTGKVNNTSNATYAQINKGTKLTIPVVKGAVITFNGTSGTAAAGDITFGGENGTVSGAVTTYTYGGATGTLDIIDTKGGFYPSNITVYYPASIVTITPAKTYTTYVTTQALDFEGTGLTAYKATAATKTEVTLIPVTAVPSGTPLVLKKGTDASYDVPVAASADAITGNLLKASDGVTPIGGTSVYDYILSNGLFYRADEGVLAEGKAYLHLEDAPDAARELVMSFGDEATGIDSVTRDALTNGKVYNLQGQEVKNAQKGIFIVNGRKVVLK